MQILIVTGISDSGKSVVLNVLEDAGYYCVDNLPAELLSSLCKSLHENGHVRVAVSCDIRSVTSLHQLPEELDVLKQEGHTTQVLFLTASTECLVQRFSETRRRHPLNNARYEQAGATLLECIEYERELIGNAGLEGLGDVLDTSGLHANVLRNWVKDFVAVENRRPLLLFESFAFKHGVPLDADLVFDVRCLPNPYYDIALRPLTGLDAPVQDYLKNFSDVQQMLQDIQQFVSRWLPAYVRENRNYLTVGIGCTGGQHRSVFCVEQLAAHFGQNSPVLVRHRVLAQQKKLADE